MTTSNYSIYAIPAFFILALIPHEYASALRYRGTNGLYDNRNPRGASYSDLVKKSLDKATLARVERAKAAETNAYESLPLFAAAVICANMAGLDHGTLNSLSGAFIALRIAYIPLYIGIDNLRLSFLRTFVWIASVGCCFTLLIKAGNVLVDGKRMVL